MNTNIKRISLAILLFATLPLAGYAQSYSNSYSTSYSNPYYAPYPCGTSGTVCDFGGQNTQVGSSYSQPYSNSSTYSQYSQVQTAGVANAVNTSAPQLPNTGGGGRGFAGGSGSNMNIFWSGLIIAVISCAIYFMKTREDEPVLGFEAKF